MTSTLSTYLQISDNLTKWQTITASDPTVKSQTAYYEANIGSVKKPSDLVGNYRLFSYAMNAYGLGDEVYAKALMQKVLEQGVDSTKDLAYTLNDPRILALAKTFDFVGDGDSVTSSPAATTDVVNRYVEQTLEANEGESNKGVQLALYFQRNAPNITNVYSILADKSLLTVVQTALGISSLTSAMNIDTQAKLISNALDVSDFKDSTKLQKFIQKFCVMQDVNNSSSSGSASSSSASVLSLFNTSSSDAGISTDLLSSIQGVHVGRF